MSEHDPRLADHRKAAIFGSRPDPRMMLKRYSAFFWVFVLGLGFCALPASAQYFRQSSYWKTHRQELSFGFGISNFLGRTGRYGTRSARRSCGTWS